MLGFNYKTLLIGGTAAMAFMGCGGGSTGLDSLGDDALAADCDFLFRCAGDEDTAYDRLFYGTEAACFESEQGTNEDFVNAARPFIDAGTVVYDAGAAQRCLAGMRRSCSYTVETDAACDAIFVGQVADGGGCTADVECASRSCSGSDIACGSCDTLLATGSPCMPGDRCADGPNGESGYCFGTCELDGLALPTADATLGNPCGDYDQECEPGLFCQDDVCARWRTLDDVCDPNSDSCEPGTYCRESEDDEDVGTCVAVRMETGPGEACGALATEFVVCDPRADLYCTDDENGVCALYQPTGEVGEYCFVTAECVDGLVCLDGACLAGLLPDGSDCDGDGQCESGNCVQQGTLPFNSTCQSPLICP